MDLPAADGVGKKLPAGHGDDYGSPTTQQLRTVGRRRRDAEEKLELHLQEARAKH
ncbi:MAG TPA: hypothetical protein VFD99_04615 [Arthrobacter sp.]|nr:hypothetical protein [Arthrobacter sp.]